ncbi:MAG: hypothetical protein ACK50Y_11250 [Flavobacteriia bacterium]
MKIETTNALDGTITIDEAAKKVTIAFTTLRAASFTSAVTIDSTTPGKGINITLTPVGSGTVGTVAVSLSAIPSGTYGYVKVTTVRTPTSVIKQVGTITI